MSDYSKYERMRDAGSSSQDIYLVAKQDGIPSVEFIHLLRSVFNISLPEARSVIADGNTNEFENLVEKYKLQREKGVTPEQLYLSAKADAIDGLTCIRLLRAVFNLSSYEVKEVLAKVDSGANSLDDYQAKIASEIRGHLKDLESD